jgi:hypothetical protein
MPKRDADTSDRGMVVGLGEDSLTSLVFYRLRGAGGERGERGERTAHSSDRNGERQRSGTWFGGTHIGNHERWND